MITSVKHYNTNIQIKFNTKKLKSSLCDYSDAYILVIGTITLVGKTTDAEAMQTDRYNKQKIFKNSEPSTDCIAEINNVQTVNVKAVYAVMIMYNLIKHSENCSGTTGNLWQYHKYDPKNPITNSNSSKFKARFLTNANKCGIINAETAVPIKYLNIFWRTLKMYLINCEMNLILICSSTCVIAGVNRETSFPITDTKLI